MMHSEVSIFYLDILKHEHADMESAKANMVAHVLRSTDTTHSIRKVTILILTMMNSYIRILLIPTIMQEVLTKNEVKFFPLGSRHPFC